MDTLISGPGAIPAPATPLFPADTSDVVEVSLLLSSAQIAALEGVAYRRGQTAAEMVRQVLQDFIKEANGGRKGPHLAF